MGDNPADLVTRGTTNAVLSTSLWTNGPSWLTDESKRPYWNPSALALHLQTDSMETDQLIQTDPLTSIDKIIVLFKYNTLSKLLHVTTGYVLRFVTNIIHPTAKQTGPLTVKKLSTVKIKWIFNCQLAVVKEYSHNTPVSNTTKSPYLLLSQRTLTTLAAHATHGGVNCTVTEADILDYISTEMY